MINMSTHATEAPLDALRFGGSRRERWTGPPRRYYVERAPVTVIQIMPEPVTNEMLLECIQSIHECISKMEAELMVAASEARAWRKEMALFLQTRLEDEQVRGPEDASSSDDIVDEL